MPAPLLQREHFQTSRLLEYFSAKELTLQTGHEPARWPEVVLKELIDNALDACEDAGTLPTVTITIAPDAIVVEDNGPGLPATVIDGILDFSVRASSKDAYISPTRGAQGNALKTVAAIPYVLSGCERGDLTIASHGLQHTIRISVDRVAQMPVIQHDVHPDASSQTGTRIAVHWPDSACRIGETDPRFLQIRGTGLAVRSPDSACSLTDTGPRFLQMVAAYALFNPHATFVIHGARPELADAIAPILGAYPQTQTFARTVDVCGKWVASQPTSPHWYTAEQLRTLMAAYITLERAGGTSRTVRQFISEFHGLSSTAKQKAILASLPVARVHLRDLVQNGDLDHTTVAALLAAMQEASRPVKPAALGVLGEAHITTWLQHQPGGADDVRYTKTAGIDDETGLPFVIETAFALQAGDGGDGDLRLLTGINSAPTLVDPFRALTRYGVSLKQLLGQLHVRADHAVTVVLHLACPHLNYTDRGKSSLEAL
jgi:DNA topoisomerase VI subunit B